jgi:hypothetical protein
MNRCGSFDWRRSLRRRTRGRRDGIARDTYFTGANVIPKERRRTAPALPRHHDDAIGGCDLTRSDELHDGNQQPAALPGLRRADGKSTHCCHGFGGTG